MKARRYFLSLVVCFCCVVYATTAESKPVRAMESPVPHVDERVELFSIAFRLAGNSEYNMNSLPTYSSRIDRYFAQYKNHPAIQMARALAEKNGVGFDAVMNMAISVSAPPELKPLVNFTPTVPDSRWGDNAEKFLALLRDFYHDSNFAQFYASQQPMYRLAEQRFATILASVDFDWYRRFYGKAPELAYNVVLGMNNGGGNYGPHLVHPDGRLDLFSIIGCWTHDDAGNPTYPAHEGYLSNIIHEFNHSFVNPAVASDWKDFAGARQVYAIVADQMRRMAYGDSKTMVDESLVRAAVILYFRQAGENRFVIQRRIRQEQRRGFFWMDSLVQKLEQYEAARGRYPDFSSYIPQIALFYRQMAAHAAAEAADFRAKCAHVVNMQPFANHAQSVNSSVRTITIIMDKPLDPSGGYSISKARDGGELFPIKGRPEFNAGGLSVSLPVQLKPDTRYGFVLTSIAFRTKDGYPLENYTVEFKTK